MRCSKCKRRISDYEVFCERHLNESIRDLTKRILCVKCQYQQTKEYNKEEMKLSES